MPLGSGKSYTPGFSLILCYVRKKKKSSIAQRGNDEREEIAFPPYLIDIFRFVLFHLDAEIGFVVSHLRIM